MTARSNRKRKKKKRKRKRKRNRLSSKTNNGVGRKVPSGKTDVALRLFYLYLFARI